MCVRVYRIAKDKTNSVRKTNIIHFKSAKILLSANIQHFVRVEEMPRLLTLQRPMGHLCPFLQNFDRECFAFLIPNPHFLC